MAKALGDLENLAPDSGVTITLRTIDGEVYSGGFQKYYRPMKEGKFDLSAPKEIQIKTNSGDVIDIPTSAIYAEDGQLVIGGSVNQRLAVPERMNATKTQAAESILKRTQYQTQVMSFSFI